MAAAGDAAKVVLIDRDYKAKETPATREQGTPDFFGLRAAPTMNSEERRALVGLATGFPRLRG